jgi:hypothetical protein
MKYWYYRDRLKYFVMPGSEKGQSVVITCRNSYKEDGDWYPIYSGIEFANTHKLLGYYIGFLATEYKLLKDNGQYSDATNTLNELNLALDALIRMDKCEDDIPWYNNQANMDGFFIREDIPSVLSNEMESYFNQNIDSTMTSLNAAVYLPGMPTMIDKNHVRCSNRFESPNNLVKLDTLLF